MVRFGLFFLANVFQAQTTAKLSVHLIKGTPSCNCYKKNCATMQIYLNPFKVHGPFNFLPTFSINGIASFFRSFVCSYACFFVLHFDFFFCVHCIYTFEAAMRIIIYISASNVLSLAFLKVASG